MNDTNRPIDQLLTKTAKQHLQTVDWDRMSKDIMGRLEYCPQSLEQGRSLWTYLTAAAAAVFILVVSLWLVSVSTSPSVLDQIETGALAAGPVRSFEDLLYRTDPQTILLTDNVEVLHRDPRLGPISVWDQPQRIRAQSP